MQENSSSLMKSIGYRIMNIGETPMPDDEVLIGGVWKKMGCMGGKGVITSGMLRPRGSYRRPVYQSVFILYRIEKILKAHISNRNKMVLFKKFVANIKFS